MDWTPLIREALQCCREGIRAGQSPFAAVIADSSGRILAAAHNTVRMGYDITAHAEINAIRAACASRRAIDLSGCVLFSTCEPCPMCAAAIHWARLSDIAWGASIRDAHSAGFHELNLSCRDVYRLGGSEVRIAPEQACEECRALFAEWQQGPRPDPY